MKIYLTVVLIVAIVASLNTCQKNWFQEYIPEPVKEKFATVFPTIKNPDWDVKGNFYEADFKLSGRERQALFNASGKLVSHSEEIDKRHLPAPVLVRLQEAYANYELEETHRLYKNGVSTYIVELENGLKEITLQLDSDGFLLMEEQEAGYAYQPPAEASLLSSSSEIPVIQISLQKPEAKWELPAELREVSGIAMLSNELMACIQDEDGILFLYDLNKKSIVKKIQFAGAGDYEGLAIAGNTAFVVRSDGAIYQVSDFRTEKPEVILHKSGLASTQNTEGLAYDKTNNRLLIACKGYDKALPDTKGIYEFSLAENKMNTKPVITIPLHQAQLTPEKRNKNPFDKLQPSSLDIHPVTGEIYLLDAVNYLLLVLDRNGQIIKKKKLDKRLLRQAEGISFSKTGEMYIATEGKKKGRGIIVKYRNGI